MLISLAIRDVVLIQRLNLSFDAGLGVLTGETGAGKSILLDALGLALGSRAEARLVRHGQDQAVVTATFDLSPGDAANAILEEQGLDSEDILILRRVLGADGRSRAFVNDEPVSVSLLRRLGEALVEVHGQFESRRLLSPANHRALLDAYGGLGKRTSRVAEAWAGWQRARAARAQAEADLAAAREDEDYLRHAVDELAKLAPEVGEEDALAEARTLMMHGEKLLAAMNDAAGELKTGRGVEDSLRRALRLLERSAEKAEGRLEPAINALARGAEAVAEGLQELDRAATSLDLDPHSLERAEERLFAIRALARKHNVAADALPALLDDFTARLAAVEDGGANLDKLRLAESAARAGYVEAAEALAADRAKAARRLDKAMAGELAPLKLDRAVFTTRIEALDEEAWGEHGRDRVAFAVATNPGAPPGPLDKIASGGELARFMLALKVVLAKADPVATIVFDEVDAGVGGAVAHAVGERLAALANGGGDGVQVLVVTHSPQVAARGDRHWRVSKAVLPDETEVFTAVEELPGEARQEEIARMLAGAKVTDEARAAADSLLQGKAS